MKSLWLEGENFDVSPKRTRGRGQDINIAQMWLNSSVSNRISDHEHSKFIAAVRLGN